MLARAGGRMVFPRSRAGARPPVAVQRRRPRLTSLVRKRRDPSRPLEFPDDDTFRFRHRLIRDAAYVAAEGDARGSARALRRLARAAAGSR